VQQVLLVVFKLRLAREIIKFLEDLRNLLHNKKFLTSHSILAQQVVLVVFKLQLAREIIKFLKELRSQLQALHFTRKF
jgi:ubiquinone biosynthesis protein COQ9